MRDLRTYAGIDTGALLDEAYAFCDGTPELEALLSWAEKVRRFAEGLDEGAIPAGRFAILEEICTVVEAHPATFAPAADWAEERMEVGTKPHALLFLDALADGPGLAEMDAEAMEQGTEDLERHLARIPLPKLQAADAAIRRARAWQAQVIELFRRQAEAAAEAKITFAAQDGTPLDEDYVLLARFEEGELLLARSRASLSVDWYGAGDPLLFLEDEELSHRPLPQGEGRRWPLPDRAPPFSLRLRLGPLSHSVRVPGPDEDPQG